MDINTFKILHSETIEFCQIIEGNLKWIYSLMHVGDIGENHSKLEKTTLGQVVSMLKELDKSSGEQFISDGDYNFLKQMTEKRIEEELQKRKGKEHRYDISGNKREN